jgi:membrane dipeptidase
VIIIDAHEDLAWNALTFGRDYRRAVSETRRLEADKTAQAVNGQALIGWPEWIRGRVAIVFGSLFAAPVRWSEGPWDVVSYDDTEHAHRLYRASLEYYQRWSEENPEAIRIIKDLSTLEAHWKAWQDPGCAGPVGIVLLMEGADGVREPGEIELWFEMGVRILGLSWSGTRYAGGTKEPGPLTDLGRALLSTMESYGMILDLSHLSGDGAREALERFSGPVIASHTAPLALVPNAEFPERLLDDGMIRMIAEREGVMGLLLGNKFLKNDWRAGMERELVGMQDIIAAIDYVCQLLGSAEHIAIGSDFEGGFGLSQIPMGLDSVADLQLIGDALRGYGYSNENIAAILGMNWYRTLQRSLPEGLN